MYVVKMTSSSYFSCILMSYFIGFFYHHHHRLLLLLKGYLYTWTVGYNSNQEYTFVMFQRNTSNSAINFGIQKPAQFCFIVNIPMEHFKKHKSVFSEEYQSELHIFSFEQPLINSYPYLLFFQNERFILQQLMQ